MKDLVSILVVDDYPEALNLTADMLEKAGYVVDRAANGVEALRIAQKQLPDMLLLDRNLPDIDGIEVCSRIKHNPALVNTLVVFASSSCAETDQQAEGLESGADGYITRPLPQRELLARVESYARIIRLSRSVRLNSEEIKRNCEAIRQAHLASLNLMEDSVAARERAEQAGQALRESEEKYRRLIENSHDIIYTLDLNGILTFVSPSWRELMGHQPEQVIGSSFKQFVHPDNHAECLARLQKMVETGQREEGMEYRVQHLNGAWFWHVSSVVLLRDEAGKASGFQGVAKDITDRKRAEKELRFSNLILLNQQEASIDGILVADDAGRVVSCNSRFAEMWGIPAEIMEPKSNARVLESLQDKLEDPKEVKRLVTFKEETSRSELALKDGRLFDCYTAPLVGSGGESYGRAWYFRDISEKKKTERMIQELSDMQRVESLGVLAGGIAHDFNNMLTGITAYLSLLDAKSDCGPDSREIISDALEAAGNAQRLTAHLLAFSKGGKPVKMEFRLDKALKEIFGLSISGTMAACEISVAENLWSVEGDENQVKQAVGNLLLNAIQAMPSGGTLRLAAGNVRLEEAGPGLLQPGDYARIVVSDTGTGIAKQYLSRIFEPYFTTKSKGHGLGLAIVSSIVKNHGGRIEALSEPGKGATFELYLPATGRRLKEEKERTREIQKGTGRVLMLEDEKVVGKAAERIFGALGYACRLTTDGEETVRCYRDEKAAGRPFDAVIMDLTIPGGMGGVEAVRKLRETDLKVPVIVSSGYSDEAVMANYKDYGFDAALPKPYKYEDVAEVLARLLPSKPQRSA